LTLYLIPAIILVIQVIRNNKILWFVTFGLFSAYIIISIIMVTSDAIERSGNHPKAIIWTFSDIITLIVILAILGIIDWIIYQLKPKRLF